MTHLPLAIFLVVFGLNILFGLPSPMWVTGLLAVVAGIMIAVRRLGLPKYIGSRRANRPRAMAESARNVASAGAAIAIASNARARGSITDFRTAV